MRTRQVAGIGIAVAWAVAGAAVAARAQGSLTPPGAPGPTMRTLAQVEPRTPVTNAPYTITRPGSYYLVTNLTSAGHGVLIQTNGVTLDLMGFSLVGDRGPDDYGVWLDGTVSRLCDVVVRGGMIRGFGIGTRCVCVQSSRFEGLTISSNGSEGVYFHGYADRACNGNIVRACTIDGNGTAGVFFLGAYDGVCDGNILAECSISGNGGDGVQLLGYAGQCNGNTLADCAISGNGGYGVRLSGDSGACNGNAVRDCAINGNGNSGVLLYGVNGECEGNTVARCTVRRNAATGIACSNANGNRIENNQVSGTSGTAACGISTDASTNNLILQNTCVGQATNYWIGARDTCGPIVTSSGTLAVTNGAAALSRWANFSR